MFVRSRGSAQAQHELEKVGERCSRRSDTVQHPLDDNKLPSSCYDPVNQIRP